MKKSAIFPPRTENPHPTGFVFHSDIFRSVALFLSIGRLPLVYMDIYYLAEGRKLFVFSRANIS